MKTLKIGNLCASVPIVQGGMGVGISLAGLASAVASEGGIGVISSAGLGVIYGSRPADYREASIRGLKEELRKAREATRGIIGVNVMVAMSNFADMVRTAIAEKADIIFSGAGLPLSLPSFLPEGARTKLAPIVSSARAAALLCRKWFEEYRYVPDAIVVEGPKAGGHLGYKREQIDDSHYSLETLVPEIVAEVSKFGAEHDCHIPVIAGGGIYTGEDIEIIESPVGMPGRALRSSFLDRVREGLKRPKACPFDCIKTCDVTHSPYCIMLALYNAFKGKLQNGYAFCGANAWRAEKIQSVRELMSSLSAEYDSFAQKIKGLAR